MNLSEIKELLRIIAESGVEEVEVEQDGVRIVVRRNAPSMTVQPSAFAYAPPYPSYGPPGYAPPYPPAFTPPQTAASVPALAPAEAPAAPAFAPAAPAPAAASSGTTMRAPIVGTYYRAASPESPPFAEVGQRVAVGDVLCIIEAMKLMNEIESEVAGTVRQILVENAQPVEYDQPLFVIDPD